MMTTGAATFLKHKRVHEPGVGIVVVGRDGHPPAIAGGYAFVFEYPFQLGPILGGNPLYNGLDLALEMRVPDPIGQTAPLDGRRGWVTLHRGRLRGHAILGLR